LFDISRLPGFSINFKVMENAMATVGYLPLRAESSHSSGMLSQVIFGEEFRILEKSPEWTRILIKDDELEGWVSSAGYQVMDPGSENESKLISTLPMSTLEGSGENAPLVVPAGARWSAGVDGQMDIHGHGYKLGSTEGWILPGESTSLVEIGQRLLSVPGSTGGRCGFGFDGPGLVQFICHVRGIRIPRFTPQQSLLGQPLSFIEEVRAGDLVFFDNEEGEIIHVGIALGVNSILHAWEQVRIDKLDHQGIYHSRLGRYSHKLRVIKRL
jgi:hypothetical protein